MYGQWGQGYPGVDPAQQLYWQQYYAAAGYSQPQQFYGAYGAPMSGMPTAANASTPATTVANPVPPAEPPKEERPPLPAEPPPDDEKLAANAEEKNKLTALQMQAAQWQQQKQWQEYQMSLVQYQQQLQQWTMQQASMLEQVNKEEEEFEKQYSDWLMQYNTWKEQNKNHPNKEQYDQYEQQWRQYEEQMSQKREYIQSRKQALLESQKQGQAAAAASQSAVPAPLPPSAAPSAIVAPTGTDTSATYTSAMYGSGAATQLATSQPMQPEYPYPGVAAGQTYPMSAPGYGNRMPFQPGAAYPPQVGIPGVPGGQRFPVMPQDSSAYPPANSGPGGPRPGFPGARPPFAAGQTPADNSSENKKGFEQYGDGEDSAAVSQFLHGARPPFEAAGGRPPFGQLFRGPRPGAPDAFGMQAPFQPNQPRPGFGQGGPQPGFGPHPDMYTEGGEASADLGDVTESDDQTFGVPSSQFGPAFGGIGFGRGMRPSVPGMGPRAGFPRGPRPMGMMPQQQAPSFLEEASENAEESDEWLDDLMQTAGVPDFGPRGMRPEGPRGMRPEGLRGMRPEAPGMRPDGLRGMRPEGTQGIRPDVPRGMRPEGPRFTTPASGLSGPGDVRVPGPRVGDPRLMLRPGDPRAMMWAGLDPRVPGLRPPWLVPSGRGGPLWGQHFGVSTGEEEYDEDAENQEGAEEGDSHEEGFGEDYDGGQDLEQGDVGFANTGFGPHGFTPSHFGLRPPGFGMERPRLDMRGPWPGFGPRGPGFGPGLRPRAGPVPLMAIQVRPPSAPQSVSKEESGVDDEAEEHVGDEETEGFTEESDQFPEQADVASGVGARMPFRPPFGPRGFLPDQRLRPPGSMLGAPPRAMAGIRGSRWPRPGFGERPMLGLGFRGPVPRFARMPGQQFDSDPNKGYGPEGGDFDTETGFGDVSEEDYLKAEAAQWGDEQPDKDSQSAKWGSADDASAERGNGDALAAKKALLFSEREHELIKKAAEELMQKKSREDISKMISPTAKKSSSEAGGGSEDDHSFAENTGFDKPGIGSFQRGFRGSERRLMDESERDNPDIPLGRGFLGERSFGDRLFPAASHELCREPWDAREEFEHGFPHPPRPDFGRGRRWNEDESRRFADFPEDEGGFPGHPRDELEFQGGGDDRFFREREFGRPHGFDDECRFLDDRRQPPEWEHEDPMHPAFRGGGRGQRFPLRGRPFPPVEDDFPPRGPPFGIGPRPGEGAHVIDYGHGRQNDDSHDEGPRSLRDESRRWTDDEPLREHRQRSPDSRREFRDSPDLRRGGGRPFGEDVGYEGRSFRPHSRSPPWRQDRSRDRSPLGRSRESDRFPPMRSGGFDMDHPRERDFGFGNPERDTDDFRNRGMEIRGFRGEPPRIPPPPRPAPTETRIETVRVDDLLVPPSRFSRPDHIVVIIRGLPGAGKTYVSKLLKDTEVANGGTAPRMLCLDDYFVVEVEKVVTDPETGKKIKRMVMEYEYDVAMETSYQISFLKSFKRQIDDCYFNFIIVDAVFDKVAQLEEFWSYAMSKGFQVYVAEVTADVATCTKRNTHQRKQAELQKIIDGWEETPKHYLRLDLRSLLQEAAIENVEMEDTSMDVVEEKSASNNGADSASKDDDDDVEPPGYHKSKWELDTSEEHLDKLDGIRLNKKNLHPQRMEDYLQLPDDYESRTSEPGKKRVRWADIEERKDQMRRRELGFVIGQTDWAKMTDDTYADRALNRTKYI